MNNSDFDWIDEFLDESIPIWQDNPVQFFIEVLEFYPDDWQKEAAMALSTKSKVAIKSGQGVGKTGFEAAALLWFLVCFPDARVVATAPTKQQLHDVLWSEIAKWQSRSPLLCELLKWTKTYVYVSGYEKRWFAVARTATRPENMQGFHEDNMLFIVDEASGVADPIMEAILGTLSGENNKLIMCGNPTKTYGEFHAAFHVSRNLYHCITVSAEKSKRTNKENVKNLIDRFGYDSNVVRVRVRGLFPKQEDDVFISLSDIERSAAMTDYEIPEEPELIHIGCDVARFGDDKTVIGYKIDKQAVFHKKINGQDTMQTADDIVLLGETLTMKYKYKRQIPIKVDDGGVGGGVIDRLVRIKKSDPKRFWWMYIIPVSFGRRIKHHFFYDSTTYMMGIVREMIRVSEKDGKEVDLILPNDNDLIGQLSTRKYSMTENSKQKVESKDEIKKRKMPSPDEADCILLLCLPVKIKEERRKNGE